MEPQVLFSQQYGSPESKDQTEAQIHKTTSDTTPTVFTDSFGIEMTELKGGCFTMGALEGGAADEKPAPRVVWALSTVFAV
jgi:hypothetical protein